MNRITALACPCVLLIATATLSTGQQPDPSSGAPTPASELNSLKQAVEHQSKQIEALTQQVTELNRRIAGQKEASTPATTPSAATQGATPNTTQPPAPPSATPASTTVAPATEVKQDQPAPDGVLKHTVAKGETLTSIAKRYNIPLGELEKFNKITDDRKLQIGHVLNIPTTANKAPEPPTEKKENP